MDYGHTTAKNEEEFWRKMRHSEDNPSYDIRLLCLNGRYMPGVRSLRRLEGGAEITVNFRVIPPEIIDGFPDFAAIMAQKISAYEKEMKINSLVKANEDLYRANKKRSAENTALEAKLAQRKRTVGSLMDKIEMKAGKTMNAEGDGTQSLPNAVRILRKQLLSENGEELSAVPMDAQSRLIVALTAQLGKINTHDKNLQQELVRLRGKHAELRQRKKENDGKKNP